MREIAVKKIYGVLALCLLAGCFLSLATGSVSLNLFKTLVSLFSGHVDAAGIVVRDIRLPRTLLALLVGGSLGLSGAAIQGFLRNPLAEPGILGISGGAVLGAVAVLYSGAAATVTWMLPAGGLAGALVAVVMILLLSARLQSTLSVILAGIALNTLFFALTSLVLNMAPNPYSVIEIVFWQMGSLTDRSWEHVYLALPFILSGCLLLYRDRRVLEVLSLGDDTAVSMGVNLRRLSLRVVFGTALAVGAAVSVCGAVSFVGLIVPHLLRPFVRHRPSQLLGVSALGGALLVLVSDLFLRWLPLGSELKLGVVTAMIGAPFFILLVIQTRRTTL